MSITDIVVFVITLLIGTGTGGTFVAWRKDARQAPIDEQTGRRAKIEVTRLIEEMATEAVRKARDDIKAQEDRHRRELAQLRDDLTERIETERQHFRKRIKHLERLMVDGGIEVPAWKEDDEQANLVTSTW